MKMGQPDIYAENRAVRSNYVTFVNRFRQTEPACTMPVTLKLPLPGGGTLALWKIDEPEPVLASLCTAGEREAAAHFSAAARRCEFLAWHALLHELVPGTTAAYDGGGGPVLLSDTRNANTIVPHIGVSHARGYAAVIVAPQRCAVDIEHTDRDFSRAASRFIAPEEEPLRNDCPAELFPAAVWCAKEAAYKWLRQEGVDFLKDIRISSLQDAAGHHTFTIDAVIAGHPLQLHGMVTGTLCCVYTTG